MSVSVSAVYGSECELTPEFNRDENGKLLNNNLCTSLSPSRESSLAANTVTRSNFDEATETMATASSLSALKQISTETRKQYGKAGHTQKAYASYVQKGKAWLTGSIAEWRVREEEKELANGIVGEGL
jgi:hypothetical protein